VKHPAERFIKYLLLKTPNIEFHSIRTTLIEWHFLLPLEDGEQAQYFNFLRAELEQGRPQDFDPSNRVHRPSVRFLRQHGIYGLFFPTSSVEEAWDILGDPEKRATVEQFLLARLNLKRDLAHLNRQTGWRLSSTGVEAYQKFFWDVKALSFDEWGRFLYGRTMLYERALTLLQAPKKLAYFHMRFEQENDSKSMILRAQQIAYHTLEEVSMQPGVGPQKVKAIGILAKSVLDCHEALMTSDLALREVIDKFKQFQMERDNSRPKSIHELAAAGNYSGSGVDDDEVVH